MYVLQHTDYFITEWDGSRSLVKVRTLGGRVASRRKDGSPHTKTGGAVVMRYHDGVEHTVSASYFASLSPQVAIPGVNLWN